MKVTYLFLSVRFEDSHFDCELGTRESNFVTSPISDWSGRLLVSENRINAHAYLQEKHGKVAAALRLVERMKLQHVCQESHSSLS